MQKQISLELGDIININAPRNSELHNKIFFIEYIDANRIDLINEETLNKSTLTLTSKKLDDKSIMSIELLDRNKDSGYAKQNGLNVGSWIDIFFGGDIPQSITGLITDQIEDMIEISVHKTDEKLYIDFEYKGIPDNYPINSINLRAQPNDVVNDNIIDNFINTKQSGYNAFEQLQQQPEDINEEDMIDSNLVDDLDEDGLNAYLNEADQIIFGEELKDMQYYVEAPTEEKVYDIDDQLEDLQNDILATIPSTERSYQKMYDVNRILNRFKELREKFSHEENGILKPKLLNSNQLVKNISQLTYNTRWLIPVVKHDKNYQELDVMIETFDTMIETFKTSTDSTNKYLQLLSKLKDFAPFDPNPSHDDSLAEIVPEERIEVLVKKYSSSKEFVPETYLNKQYGTIPNGKFERQSVLFIEGDVVIPTSFIQTDIQHLDYTQTSLIHTDLLVKSIKPAVNLWEHLSSQDIISNVVDLNSDLLKRDMKHDKYFDNIAHHTLVNNSEENSYERMLLSIIPKTNDIINNLDRYYGNIYNVKSFIKKLNWFMIDEITKANEAQILKSVNKNIKNYIGNVSDNKSSLKILKTAKYETNYKKNEIDGLLQNMKERSIEIYNVYGTNKNDSDAEIFNEMMKQDNLYLLNIVLSNSNAGLLITESVEQIIDDYKLQVKSKYSKDNDIKNKKCNEYVIAKRYDSIEAIEQDNKAGVVYYDIEYDNTPYVLKEDYYAELSTLSEQAAIEFIQDKLVTNLGIKENDSQAMAKNIVEGRRPVTEGLYALVDTVDELTDKIKRKYYIRNDNIWVEADINDDTIFTSNNKDICNLQEECVSTNRGCISTEGAINKRDENFANELLNDFANIKMSKEALVEDLNNQYRKQLKTIIRLREIRQTMRYKYDRQQKNIGMLVEETDPIISPYSVLLDKIVGQYDFDKKQMDLIDFYEQFCRVPKQDEDQYWYYCRITHVKLMPTFMKQLADAFKAGRYVEQVNKLCASRGGLSDDGNAWIDKHSGYKIKDIEYSEDQGYDDTGFKAISRALLEADAGDEILKEVIDVQPGLQKNPVNSELQKMIKNITKTILLQMSVSLDTEPIELDIENTILKLLGGEIKDIKTSKQVWKAIIFITLSYLLIALQTAVPPIVAKKTFPGCVKSFSGYPYDGTNDTSGLEYICCVALGIKSSIPPWSAIRKTSKSDLIAKLKDTILPNYVLVETMVKNMILNKRKFMKTYRPVKETNYNLDNWNTFLPPLKKIEMSAMDVVPQSFEETLIGDIKLGKSHTAKLDILKNKCYFTSLNIQNKINEIVKTDTPLMITMNNVPFVENACCQEEYKTITYFTNKSKTVNDAPIRTMMKIYNKYLSISKASILYDPVDNRKIPVNEFPGYSEELIYRAFIGHCKYNIQKEAPDRLKSICMRCPDDYKTTDTISNKIRTLKNNGVQYSIDNLKELMNILNADNIIATPEISNIEDDLEEILDNLNEDETELNDAEFKIFCQNFRKALGGTLAWSKLQEYLFKTTELMIKTINKQSKSFNQSSKHKKLVKFFDMLRAEDKNGEAFEKSIKNAIINIIKIIPNMILNKTSFEYYNSIPSHWNISDRHVSDIAAIIQSQNNLKSNFDIPILNKLCYKITMSNFFITTIIENINGYEKETTKEMLVFIMVYVLKQYITLSVDDMPEMKTISKPIGKQDNASIHKDLLLDQVEEVDIDDVFTGDIMKYRIDLLSNIIDICNKEFSHTMSSYEYVMAKVEHAKITEKDNITHFLNSLTIEERETENLFKNNKLEKWSVGLQKGLRIYDKETYEREMQETDERTTKEIDNDNEINVVDDDDYGELDGDEEF